MPSMFIEGPVGSGKTTHALQHIHTLLEQGAAPETILVLVPQRVLGQPYQTAFHSPDWPDGAQIDVVTLGGLARRGLEIFWPLVAAKAGFQPPITEPRFLTIETSQYYMAQFVQEAIHTGVFDSLNLAPFRIMNQILDILSKAAVNQFSLNEVSDRLIAAWGDRHSSRPPVYRASIEVARQFQSYCIENCLLDFSLQIDFFMNNLITEGLYQDYIERTVHHLVADNLEENFWVTQKFIRWLWPALDTALLLYDTAGGYRAFLGADPSELLNLAELCDEHEKWERPSDRSPALTALALEFTRQLDEENASQVPLTANPRQAFTFQTYSYYPDMIAGVVDWVTTLIDSDVPPGQIVILAPFLGDSLRFSLLNYLAERNIPVESHRPSRAVRDEPAARSILTWMALAHPSWNIHPPVRDIANALHFTIPDLDPVRAWLLAQIVYHPNRKELGAFDSLESKIQMRITYRAGKKYEHLREWLTQYAREADYAPPDSFLSKLFGEVLSQPGYGFHSNLDAGRVVAELVESARKFRQTLYPQAEDNWLPVAKNYFELVQEGLLAALYVSSWTDDDQQGVLVAPAYTFLMRNKTVDYQIWLDIGSNTWWERLEQPLTHPYVLSRSYPSGQIWTDDLEFQARQQALLRLTVGLVSRCNAQIYAAISNLSEQGYEQRGPLLRIFQQIIHDGSES